jgi:hypothetical protein
MDYTLIDKGVNRQSRSASCSEVWLVTISSLRWTGLRNAQLLSVIDGMESLLLMYALGDEILPT